MEKAGRIYRIFKNKVTVLNVYNVTRSGFGGLGVPKFAGSNPAEAIGFLGRKNPQYAFLRRGSKPVGPVSYICGM